LHRQKPSCVPEENNDKETAMKLNRILTTAVGAGMLGLLASCAAPGSVSQDSSMVIDKANRAMGAATVKSIRFAGTGIGATYGQAFQPNLQWPRLNYSSFSRLMDFDNAAMREEFARSRAEATGGGAVPLMGEGEQRVIALVRGDHAWNLIGPAPQPAPVALDARIHDLWTSPHGVLKAAMKNKATASKVLADGKTYSVLSFTEPGRFSAKAYVNEQGLVERVDSRLPNHVVGDSSVVTTYSGYKDSDGVQFPRRITQTQESVPVMDIEVTEVQVNPPADIAVPELIRVFSERAASERAADGVWFIGGGSHNSVVIEMRDHVILVESPLYDGRAAAVIAEVKRLVPNKPIRYVVNSHHHFDHSGGVRAAVSEGATLITSNAAVPFFQRVLANPNSIKADLLSKSGKAAKVEGVNGKRVLTDGSRNVELHLIGDSVHANGFVMAYLPAEKLLIEADAYTPGAPNSPPPGKPNGNNLNLIDNIERLGLKVERILPLHGRMVPVSELYVAAGKKPV
jgi:glyoxylase-like metal-dependent hydrolase (beta-lactamase superfamily II)